MSCAVIGCERKSFSRGLCGTHYQRVKITGNLEQDRPIGVSRGLNWLKSNADVEHENCVEWPFSCGNHGYDQIYANGRNKVTSRVCCEIFHGPAPTSDHQAAHRCGNRKCVNKNHIRWATPKENCADKLMHGTHRCGEANASAKLSNAQAASIRSDNRPTRFLARLYGIDPKAVRLIKQGKTYLYKAALGM